MSNKLGDFSKFCGLLKISELYQAEDGVSNSEQDTVQIYTYLQTNMEVNLQKSKEWCMNIKYIFNNFQHVHLPF